MSFCSLNDVTKATKPLIFVRPDRIPGQPPLDEHLKGLCFGVFLKTLQSPMPPDTDELFYCLVRTTRSF